jgi:pimeloyl-ACP methyl ester carboxylesterase
MFVQRLGAGRPLLLLHGIGGSWRSWTPLSRRLAADRLLVIPDLPGFGDSPPEGLPSFQALANTLEAWLAREGLEGVEAVGHSLGGQLVLELATRGRLGRAVALCPGGYWVGWERAHVASLLLASAQMARAMLPALPALAGTASGRMLMAAQFSARPWALEPDVLLSESLTLAASRWLEPLAAEMLVAPQQAGAADLRAPLIALFGGQDRVCFPHQRARAEAAFPTARFDTLPDAGHCAHWDEPEAVLSLVRDFLNAARLAA